MDENKDAPAPIVVTAGAQPTGDQVRAIIKSVGSLGTNHADAPMEYVLAGWRAAKADERAYRLKILNEVGDALMVEGHQWAYEVIYRMMHDARSTLAQPSDAAAEPVAWFIADDNGDVYRATGYEHERDQWRAVGHEVYPLFSARSAASGQKLTDEQRKALEVAADALIERYAAPIRALLSASAATKL